MVQRDITVDFIAQGATPAEWIMVLVESGPWTGPADKHLRRIQDRLYGCLDAALDGQLAERFPSSKGQRVTIRLDGYDLPELEVREFFDRFRSGVLATPDYAAALDANPFVRAIDFEICLDQTP